MSRAILLTVLLAGLIVIGSGTSAWAAQLEAVINPNNESSPFKMSYLKNINIEYPNGGDLADALQGREWTISGSSDSSNPEVQNLINRLNQKIASDASQAKISDMTVNYEFQLKSRDISTSIDYKIILEGTLTDYIITEDSQRTLIDLGWRGISTDSQVNIDGNRINYPSNLLRDNEPEAHAILAGTEADEILNAPLIDADFILEQPITNWHFLFDPAGIGVDAGTFGLDEEIKGFVVSKWTMGESSVREGRQVEEVIIVTVVSDKVYTVKSTQSADIANLSAIGFGALDILDGVEIAGITPTAPEGYATTSTGDFPIFIVYGMAGIAAIAGIAFFFISSRSLKNERQGQQGIDPSRLQGYQTSASAGGYQTNRGEAQLKDETDYQQTRSVYDNNSTQSPPQGTTSTEEAACGCAASAEMGSECDCAMQSSCLCDGTCKCSADICKEHVNSMQ